MSEYGRFEKMFSLSVPPERAYQAFTEIVTARAALGEPS
jgi:hypothetical protein